MPSLPQGGYRKVECKTIDGITIRGWFYAVEGPSPAIIMTHGVSRYGNLRTNISPHSTHKLAVQLRQRNAHT